MTARTQRSAGLLVLLCLAPAAAAQVSVPAPAPKPSAQASAAKPAAPDYAQEPFIFEQYTTKVRFENDGTGERNYVARIRAQNPAGVQALGELTFGYNSGSEQIDMHYVRVRKPDGSLVTAGPEAAKEMTAAVVRDAPVYTDYKEKHVTVPSLEPGDTVEYDVSIRLTQPLAPGEFWYAQNFLAGGIILDERLEVSLPDGRAVKIASPVGEYQTSRANGRVIYSWKHAHLEHDSEEGDKPEASKQRAPDVQFTTFKSWEDVSQWYAKLEEGRTEPTPALRAKVAELTQGKTADLDKMQALYDYVAKNVRYVSLSFGLGRYQPHEAGEIFRNEYGDCKDKATLLSAMMRAANIPSDVALIAFNAKLDESMPSPSQFDHVITVVPHGSDLLWMDSTAEVAPFRLLSFPLRDKSALLVPADGKGKIVRTPADPPFASTQDVSIEGSVSDLGKLNGTLHYALRGDQEFVLRLAFRRAPQSQWKDIGTTILQLDGLHGVASSVTTSDPSDTRSPFELKIEFTEPNFLVWSSKKARVSLPLLSIGMPDPPKNEADPVLIGSPLDVTTHLKLTLPPTFRAQPPIAVAVTRDYADFKSTYAFDGHTVSASRTLNFKMRELPAERASDYLAFVHAVQADAAQTLMVENSAAGAPEIPGGAKPEELLDAANAALNNGNPQAAIPLYQRLVELQPDHKQAWNQLGLSYMKVGQRDEAITSFRKQLEVNPYDEHSNDYLGAALAQQQKYDDAAAAFRKQLEINPLDPVAHLSLGDMLLEQHKYADAIPELDKASALLPDNPGVQVNLGRAYLNTGAQDKALEAFDKAAETSQTPFVWNDIAYDLADARIQLDKAQQYAESAVSSASADLRNIGLAHLTLDQLGEVASIANYWDTLGWVYFQQGDFGRASRYIRASWLLSEHGEVADHLAQVYEKQGKKDQAAHTYAMAIAAPHSIPETRSRLMLLLGGNEKVSGMVTQAQPQLLKQRTYPAGKLLAEKADAAFEFLLSPSGTDGAGTKIDSVVFISGSEKLRPLAEKLHAIDFGPMFPDASPVHLVRRGNLSCSASGDCSLDLILPEDIHTLN